MVEVIILFDSATSTDNQHILEKLSTSCARCVWLRVPSPRVECAGVREVRWSAAGAKALRLWTRAGQ